VPIAGDMERKDAILLVALAGAGAWAVYANWDTIRDKVGVDDLSPGKLKAVQLAKDAFTWNPPAPNWMVLRDREKNGEIELPAHAWRAYELQSSQYRVTCTWVENGASQVHVFRVDIGSSAVAYDGLEGNPPAPR
jgi:hypothetical protein